MNRFKGKPKFKQIKIVMEAHYGAIKTGALNTYHIKDVESVFEQALYCAAKLEKHGYIIEY